MAMWPRAPAHTTGPQRRVKTKKLLTYSFDLLLNVTTRKQRRCYELISAGLRCFLVAYKNCGQKDEEVYRWSNIF